MLARVLFVLLAGVPACRAAACSPHYDAAEDVHNADFYDSYNQEIKSPQVLTTVVETSTLEKRRDLKDIRTLNPKEIIDVKGILNNIFQGKNPDSVRGRRRARDYTDSYNNYLENYINGYAEVSTNKGPVVKKWQPTDEVHKWSPEQEYLDGSTSQSSEKYWSFVFQPETSTYGENDIIAEVRKLIPARDGEVPSINVWRPNRDVQTRRTTEETEETEETEDTLMYPLESTTYINSDIQAQVRKLVQRWSTSSSENMQKITTPFSNPDMQAEVKKLIQHWSMQKTTMPFSNPDMQAEVKKLIQHWSVQESTTPYSNSDMQAEVRKLVQHWSSVSSVNINQQNTGMQTEVSKLESRSPILDHKHWSAPDNVQHQNSSMNVQHWSSSENAQHWSPIRNIQHRIPSNNVQHWGVSDDVQYQNPLLHVQHQDPSMNIQLRSSTIDVQQWNRISANNQENLPFTASETDRPIGAEAKVDTAEDDEPEMRVELRQNGITTTTPPHSTTTGSQHDPTTTTSQYSTTTGSQHDPTATTSLYSTTTSSQHDPTATTSQYSTTASIQHDPNATTSQYSTSTGSQHDSTTSMSQYTSNTTQYFTSTSSQNETFTSSQNETFTSSQNETFTSSQNETFTSSQNESITSSQNASYTSTSQYISNTTEYSISTRTYVPTTTRLIDIDVIMAIISNLTYDYEWNLTEQFNKSIIEHGVPTCPWEKWGPGGAWTSTTVGVTYGYDFENTSVVSKANAPGEGAPLDPQEEKCFVCGLQTPEIPRNAHCADAFAGDFLPLMPIDAQSRGKIAGFRKYCRYYDTQNYLENPDEPRAIYGRFTGGCAVRWTDITGVYTQRTCRSKYRPLLGKHFASKRMAKLELALVNVENGCIISPMATLLPVSRGISLYARFHACVCSTNWCNRATHMQASFNTLVTIVLAYWLVLYP